MSERIKRDPEKGLIIWGSGGDATLEKGPIPFEKDGIEYYRIFFSPSENLKTLYNVKEDDFIMDKDGKTLPYIFKDYPRYFMHICGDLKTPMIIILCDWIGKPLPDIIRRTPIDVKEVLDAEGKVISTEHHYSLKPFSYVEVVEHVHSLQRQIAQKVAQLNQKDKEIDRLQENLKKKNLVDDIITALRPIIYEANSQRRQPAPVFYGPQQ